ncbi:nucleotide sugar dehydrogenase [Mucilaginibacter sp. KACC 22773]|jgi:UDP-N-acetyl-D-galactosamine dehydrogenase|uniref:nucleotide sugar dehydrogenase n=1 Tax=Mucilaginibacter sp. KACC 22773 TaxID=3025671 RepID=UPI0023673490|nr:nucleotide sugar dehydrogenase [Mucilaginibacter sp. KACC 22773]WDF80777.1 nucleotide sugar dehydrogenase [Mucilaginibacter sp. KACC 22773]
MFDHLSNQIQQQFNAPETTRIAIIGLGYVGLPLAVEFAKKFPVKGFDIKKSRVDELNNAFDRTLETDADVLGSVLSGGAGNGLVFTSDIQDIADCNVYIISVPTPTDQHNRPDLDLIKKASESVASVLKVGDVVIYESTVYPGVTEDICVPILERISELKFNVDFYAGYSPERINPGDKVHTLTNILKVTSGSTPQAANFIDNLYQAIVTAGTHKAPSIKVAEACKVIENSQRDINIAFVNELAKIFQIMGIDTHAVLEAAGTKWNFLNFKPGLVGGHCTGVDPYYLAQKAQEVGYHPEIILAGRRLNDGMGTYVALEVIKLMVKKEIPVKNSNVLVLGFTFKENCPDVRNTRVIDIVKVLSEFEACYEIYDPWADPSEVELEYRVKTIKTFDELKGGYDAIIVAVSHKEFFGLDYNRLKKEASSVIYDIKGILDKGIVDGRL